MSAKANQYTVGKEWLHFFYRFVILPWELEWESQQYRLEDSNLNKFCQDNNISIKSFASTAQLREAISKNYESDANRFVGLFWFVRRETKPKDALRHLRNCLAHGHYKKRQKNKVPCLVIENIDKASIKAKGFLPLRSLDGFVRAASSRAIC